MLAGFPDIRSELSTFMRGVYEAFVTKSKEFIQQTEKYFPFSGVSARDPSFLRIGLPLS
jgi:hypothetical protein